LKQPISTKEYILQVFGHEPETLDELAQCVIAVINSQHDEHGPNPVQGFAWRINYSPCVSNYHQSPEGYPRRTANNPRQGYPGWTGRVWIRYRDPRRKVNSFARTLTYSGTGGAGSYHGPWQEVASQCFERYGLIKSPDRYPEVNHYSWTYEFFEADWPLIAQWAHKKALWEELSGKPWQRSHAFQWTDPDVLAADKAFIAECVAGINSTTV
jgi:hypothetical protein